MNRVDTESSSLRSESIFHAAPQDAATTLCAWCGRIKKAEGEWQHIPADAVSFNFTHGICPECMAFEMRSGQRN